MYLAPTPQCPSIADPENGLLYLIHNNQIAVFYCNSGYDIQGTPILICINGRWNLPSPKCIKER